jgi:hypothetical protein
MALTKKIRAAIDQIVFQGLTRADAAKAIGITDNALYQALRKPAVLAYWNEALQVLRTGERPRNLHRLVEIRDQNANLTAAVQAIKLLEPQEAQGASISLNVNIQAGYVIDLSEPERTRPMVDVTPTDSATGDDRG